MLAKVQENAWHGPTYPILEDCPLRSTVVEYGCDVDVSDLIVAVIRSRSDFFSSNKDVLEFAGGVIGLNSSKDFIQVSIGWDIESSIPLAVFVGVVYLRLGLHLLK